MTSDESVLAFRQLTAKALGVDQDTISCWESKVSRFDTEWTVEVVIDKGITFAMLFELSNLLGTENINIEPAEPGHRYSSWTYDDGSPAKIVAKVTEKRSEER